MTNANKFQEVFGFNPSESVCMMPSDIDCKFNCEACTYKDWWDWKYRKSDDTNK